MTTSTPVTRPDTLPLFQAQSLRKDEVDAFILGPFPSRPRTARMSTAMTSPPVMDLVSFGKGYGETETPVEMFINPFSDSNNASATWESRTIAQLNTPTSMHYADVAGTGQNDVIIAHNWGTSFSHVTPDAEGGGCVSWLENPGDVSEYWKCHKIGNCPGTHIVKAGQFTRNDRLQIVAVSNITASDDFETPAPIIVYTRPDDPTQLWPSETVGSRHMPNDIYVVKSPSDDTDIPFDQIVLASRDGIDVLWYDGLAWQNFHVGDGPTQNPGGRGGDISSISVCQVNDDYAGYLCSAESLNTDFVCVYTKLKGSSPGIVGNTWTRTVLDTFEASGEQGAKTVRQVTSGDIDGDGVDEFLVAVVGSTNSATRETTGVWAYQFQPYSQTFTRTKLNSNPTVRIAMTNLCPTYSGLDFATTGPLIYTDATWGRSIDTFLSTGILAARLNQEVLFQIVDSRYTHFTAIMPFLEVNGVQLSLLVIPPDTTVPADAVPGLIGAKVLAGSLVVSQGGGRTHARSLMVNINNEERTPAIRPMQTGPLELKQLTSGCMGGTIFAMSKPPPSSPPRPDPSALSTSTDVLPPQAPAERTLTIRPMQNGSLEATPRTSGGMGDTIFDVSKPSPSSPSSPPRPSPSPLPTSTNIFPPQAPADVRALEFPWVRSQTSASLPVTIQPPRIDFLRLVGFHVHLGNDKLSRICRFEFTATGMGTSTGFDNRLDESMSEIRACIINATGEAGMRVATVPDSEFDPDHPDLSQTKLITMKTLTEHGALWRTTRDGLPMIRDNDTVDYPWNGWHAGGASGEDPAFDIFTTFQFPPFMTFSASPSQVMLNGTYIIRLASIGQHDPIGFVLALQGSHPVNRAPAIAVPPAGPYTTWKISPVLGTDMYEISHSETGLLLGSRWPPLANQSVVGLSTPAAMGLTTRFSIFPDAYGNYIFRLTSQVDGDPDLLLGVSIPQAADPSGDHGLPVMLRPSLGFQEPSWSLTPA